MFILKIAAFWLPVIGIGAIAGAIETGTSPVKAVIIFLTGCFLLALYIRLDSIRYRKDKKIDRLVNGACRKYNRCGGRKDRNNETGSTSL